MPYALPRDWRKSDLDLLPEDGRQYELIDGQLFVNGVEAPGNDPAALTRAMTPAPSWRHGTAVLRLYDCLHRYLVEHRVAEVRLAPTDIDFTPRRVVQPDVFVVPLVDGRGPRSWAEAERLLLAVEVLSPTTARLDRVRKRRVYQDAAVPEYWIVDLDARLVERWRPGDDRPELIDDRLVWQPSGVSEGEALVIDLAEYFAD